ncbi:MAG: hypothetical protein OHK0046_39750 [Anaerolineae bacterium]
MLKKFFALIVLVVLALGVVSAQDESQFADVALDGVTVTYWHEWTGNQATAITEIIALFNETNEYGITVEEVALGGGGEVSRQVAAGILSGELPNIAGDAFVSTAKSYFIEEVLVPLDQFYGDAVYGFSEEELADLNQQLLDVNRPVEEPYNGALLSWPVGQSLNVLSVNMDMLAELGYDAPPADLAAFEEVACAAAELSREDGGDVQGFPIRTDAFDFYSFVKAQGGELFNEETQTYTFTDEATISVLTTFQNMFNNGCAYIPDGPFVNTADFAFGLNPMALGSSAGIPFIQGDINTSESGIENWIMTTVPWSEGNRALQVFLRSNAILVSTPEQELASWVFLKFLASTEAQVTWTEATNYIPYTFSGLEGLSPEFFEATPQFQQIRDLALSEDVQLWSAPAHAGSNQVAEVVSNMIVEVTTGGRDAAEAAAEAETRANEIVEENAQ